MSPPDREAKGFTVKSIPRLNVTYIVSTLLLFGACSNKQVMNSQAASETNGPDVNERYEKLVDHYSAGDSEYNGFYNAFEYRAVLLNHPVREAQLRRQANYYQWDSAKAATEEEKIRKELATETHVFVSFFTPDRNNDNLTTPKSIWRIYLDAGGKRYEGSIKRLRTLLAELQSLYPAHVRWTTPYEITFPVPSDAVEAQPSKLTITGPLGTRAVEFAPVSPR